MLLNSRCIVSKPASLCCETIAHQPPLQGEAVARKRDRWGRRRTLSLTAPPRTPPRPPEPAIGPATSGRTRWAVDPSPAGEGGQSTLSTHLKFRSRRRFTAAQSALKH